MQRTAVIDLGTNTFHLIIAEIDALGEINVLFQKRYYVMLAEESIEYIGKAAFTRALDAMQFFAVHIALFKPSKTIACGTAALRTAKNAPEFMRIVKQTTGIDISIISGDEEAKLIYEGVRKACEGIQQQSLIMDIGGGSVEFILCDAHKILWAQSFPIGVAVLKNKFHQHEPILAAEIADIKQYLYETLAPLRAALQQHPSHHLIGASGTFDILEANYVKQREKPHFSTLSVADSKHFSARILPMTLAERIADTSIPDTRCVLIPVAMVLIDTIIELADIQTIGISSYAMKEGVLMENRD